MTLATRGNVRTAAAAKRSSLPAALQGRLPHRRRRRHVHRRPRPPRRHADHHALPEHELGDPHRLRLRWLAARPVPARRRRHLHQGRRRRRRPRRQGRGRHPRGRPPQPGHHRRQRGRQRRRLRRHGRRPVRVLRGHPRGLDHPRRPGVRRRSAPTRPSASCSRSAARAIGVRRLDRRRLRREGQGGRDRRPEADQPWLPHRRHHHRRSAPPRWPSSTSATTHDNERGWRCFGAVVIGLVLAQAVSRLTEYFTGTEHRPGAGDRRGDPHRSRHHGAVGHRPRARVVGLRDHRHRHRHRLRPSPSAAATCSSRSTSSPSRAWACWPPPV